ncbi:hypothetical protein ACIBCA_20980 [Kitasatospora sp. NPDC051170]|uniref:hypothetical protein n=1 Tax=Kitasatospora sp. NPDC051170 TaxID=3364056 RepID=UPI00379181E6
MPHASELVVYDGREEVARHGRLIARGGTRLDLDHYLEALVRKPGAPLRARDAKTSATKSPRSSRSRSASPRSTGRSMDHHDHQDQMDLTKYY